MKVEIFYSWQSESPKKTNQEFIQEAAQLAIERMKTDVGLKIEPALDRDTQGVPGSPAVAEAIFLKIEKCGLFFMRCNISG